MFKPMFFIVGLFLVHDVYSMDCLRLLCFFSTKPIFMPEANVGDIVETHDGFLWKIEKNNEDYLKYKFTPVADISDRARAIRLIKAPVGYNGSSGSAVKIISWGAAVYSYNKLVRGNQWQI